MKRLMRVLLWLTLCASVFALLGVVRVPEDHLAARQAGPSGTPAAMGEGLQLGLRFWHRWAVAPKRGAVFFGSTQTPALRFDTLRTQGVQAMVLVRFTRLRAGVAVEASLRAGLVAQFAKVGLPQLLVADQRAALLATLPKALSGEALTITEVALGPLTLDAAVERDIDLRVAEALGGQRSKARDAAAQAEAAASQAAVTAAAASRAAEAEARAEEAALRQASGATVAHLRAEAEAYVVETRAAADAVHARLLAEGALATAESEAEVSRLTGAALAGRGGKWLIALEAIDRFELAAFPLRVEDPEFFDKFGSIAAWKRFFTRGLSDGRRVSARPKTPDTE
jgi:hypothetical protein